MVASGSVITSRRDRATSVLSVVLLAAYVAPAGAAVTHQLGLQKVVYRHNGLTVVQGRIRGPVTATWYFDPAITTGPAVACVPKLDLPQDTGPTPCPPCLHDEAQPIYTFNGGEVAVTRTFKRRGLHRFRVAASLPGADAVFVSSSTFPVRMWGPPNAPERYSCSDEAGLL